MAARPYRLYGMGLGDWAQSWFVSSYATEKAGRAAGLRRLQHTVDGHRMLGWRHLFLHGPGGMVWSAGLDDDGKIVEPSPRVMTLREVPNAEPG